ncbi:MAG: anthranilate phosphoribosyltransferase [Candidatus Acidiferrales bacterium]
MIAATTQKIIARNHLSRAEAEAAMEQILTGRSTEAEIVGLLTALREKGETVEELVGFATVMRSHAKPIFPADGAGGALQAPFLVDTCGTGGDGTGTFNISTAAALVVAGAGIRVAKHGNRSVSSKCGSADVLEALGIAIELSPERTRAAIEEIGFGFLLAPAVHTAMRHAMPARRKIRGQTIFNLLGPLTNPAGASAQIVGVYDGSRVAMLAEALGQLGVRRAFVVHGSDGLDEISLSGESSIAELKDGSVRQYTLTPEDFGFSRAPLGAIAGGNAHHNAEIIRKILAGESGPRREIVLANAAAALVAAGIAAEVRDGVQVAAKSIDSGAARAIVDALIQFSRAEKKTRNQ